MKYFITLLMATMLISCSAQQNDKSATEAYSDVSNEEAKSLMTNTPTLQIIDVRTDGEVAAGMISGAKQIDFSAPDFDKQLSSLDKTKPVLVYCAAGGRSKKAQDIMKEKGFEVVYNLAGGYSNWQE